MVGHPMGQFSAAGTSQYLTVMAPLLLVTHNLFLSGTAVRLQNTANRKIYHNYPPPYTYKDWLSKIGSSNFTYRSLSTMLLKHKNLMGRVGNHIRQQQQQQHDANSAQDQLSTKILSIYQRELMAVENSLVTVLQNMNQTLNSDYHSIEKIKLSCKIRQQDMRATAILVEEDYNLILELEKEMLSRHPNTSLHTHLSILNTFLSEISHAADVLEKELVEDVFSDYKKLEGVGFETVVKLSEESLFEHGLKRLQSHSPDVTGMGNHGKRTGRGGGISLLIDSASNQYTLSRPRDLTMSIEDQFFIHDIINLLLLSFVCGSLCSFFKVPSLFGYVFTGMVLGPTGLNLISCVVQVESLGEIGVIFIIFMVGLEFSPQKLQKVWNVAVYGGNLLLCCSIVLAILLGSTFQEHPQHSLFVAACLSFSSNPLATRILDRTGLTRYHATSEEVGRKLAELPELDMVDYVSGILMMQDIQLGTLMALLPFFEGGAFSKYHTHHPTIALWVLQLVQVLFGFPLLVLIFRLLAARIVEKFHRKFNYIISHPQNVFVGSVTLCFAFLLIAECVGASLELGCFLAGVVISSLGPTKIDQVKKLISPIRELMAVFFFASLGFHVYPSFLRSEFVTLCIVMATVVILKFVLTVAVLGIFVGHCRRRTIIISVSLAQVSEFSFVLSSRARRIGIISREVYLVILGITTLSLLLSPFLLRGLLLLHRSLTFLIFFSFRLCKNMFIHGSSTTPDREL